MSYSQQLLFYLQETLKELFPSWANVSRHKEVLAFTCGLMKNPMPLVNHIYNTFIEGISFIFSLSISDYKRHREAEKRLQAQGKNATALSIFSLLYSESAVPLQGIPCHNQYINLYWNDHEEVRPIFIPSRLYAFVGGINETIPHVERENIKISGETPQCSIWVSDHTEDTAKNILSTCCAISAHQSITELLLSNVECDSLSEGDALVVSKNAHTIGFLGCHLPVTFLSNILHQLSGCVDLQHLYLVEMNLYQVEEELDEMLENLDRKVGRANHQTEVLLRDNSLSEKFLKKWELRGSGILCHFDIMISDFSGSEDDLTLDEINWLINCSSAEREVLHTFEEIHISKETISHDLVKVMEMSQPLKQLVLTECKLADDMVLEALLGLPICNSLTELDFGGTKLGCNAKHIRLLMELGKIKQLLLPNCQIPATALDHLLPALSLCKELTHLNLSGNNLEAHGFDLTKVVIAWGDKSTLREVNLSHCAMTTKACTSLLFALGNSKFLTKLILTDNVVKGCLTWFLPDPYEGLGNLQELCVDHTDLSREDLLHLAHLLVKKLPRLSELDLASNSLCRMKDELQILVLACVAHHHTRLQLKLRRNNLSKIFVNKLISLYRNSNVDLYFESEEPEKEEEKCVEYKTETADTADSFGSNAPIRASEELHLSEDTLSHHLVTVIKMQFKSLNKLTLRDCIILEDTAFAAMMLLPIYKCLSVLNFCGTNLGFNARHMKDILFTCDLKKICLRDCQIPPPVCGHLLSAMSECTKIIHLDMAWNTIHRYGHDLAETILAWEARPPLKELDLSYCSMTADASKYLLSALGSCLQLTALWLPGNTLTGCLPHFIPDPHDGLHSLEKFFLNYTRLKNQDLLHLMHLVKKRKLSRLKELDLGANSLHKMAGVVEHLIEACITNYQRELKLCLWFNYLSTASVDKCKFLCSNTNIKLCLNPADDFEVRHIDGKSDTNAQMDSRPTDYAWREDEFLHGFYNDVDDKQEINEEEEVNDEVKDVDIEKEANEKSQREIQPRGHSVERNKNLKVFFEDYI